MAAPEVTSPEQHSAWNERRVPAPESLREGIWTLGMAMPRNHMTNSLAYVIEDDDGRLHVIDPGWPADDAHAVFGAFLDGIGHGIEDIATVTVTHMHPDHSGRALSVCEATGARFFAHDLELSALTAFNEVRTEASARREAMIDRWQVPSASRQRLTIPDVVGTGPFAMPEHGEALHHEGVLPIPGRKVRVLHTPGHTAGSISLLLEREGLLLTGDHLMPTMHCGLGLSEGYEGNALADYLMALDRITEFGDIEIGPGHQYRFRGIADRCRSTAEHHLVRSRAVAAQADSGRSIWEIAAGLDWSAGWENLHGFYLYSALAQTAMHLDFITNETATLRLENPVG